MNKRTLESFISDSIKIHGNKYDYSKVNYIDIHSKVLIHCNTCGKDFEQEPNCHLHGSGCATCSKKKKKTSESFAKEATELHKGAYKYSLVNYKNNSTKAEIICKKCKNHFWQSPHAHLSGQGCPYCKGTPKKTKKQFIKEAKKVHGNKYSYYKVNYISTK